MVTLRGMSGDYTDCGLELVLGLCSRVERAQILEQVREPRRWPSAAEREVRSLEQWVRTICSRGGPAVAATTIQRLLSRACSADGRSSSRRRRSDLDVCDPFR